MTDLEFYIDEYGGMEGVITLRDLIEELVGELDNDEVVAGAEQEGIDAVEENVWRVYGNVTLREVEEATGLTFEEEKVDTFNGLVLDAMDMIPADGKQDITLEIGRLQIHISRITDHQVDRATIRLLPEEEEDE